MAYVAYKFRHSNWNKKYYVDNLNAQATNIQPEIEKLQTKAEMLREFARQIDQDLIEVSSNE